MADQNHNHPILNLPYNLVIGQAVADGNCFFDSFRKGLKRLGISETINGLRNKCKEFAETNPPDWFTTAISNNYYQIQKVLSETKLEYIENILKSKRWGDPDIEGRILCKYFGVFLYIIEKQQTATETLYTYQMIDENGSRSVYNLDYDKPNTVFIVNEGKNHFEPIIDKTQQNGIPKTHNLLSNQAQANSGDNEIEDNLLYTLSIQQKIQENQLLVNQTFTKMEDAKNKGDITYLNKLIDFLYQQLWYKESTTNIFKDKSNLIRKLHYIAIACRDNQPQVLGYLLHSINIFCDLPNRDCSIERSYRLNALSITIKSLNINMLEMLYDNWSGDVHWLGTNIRSDADAMIQNLEELNTLLTEAHKNTIDSNSLISIGIQRMSINVQCLKLFNDFQIELYTKLNKLKTQSGPDANNDIEVRKNEVKAIIDILLTALSVFKEYSDKIVINEIEFPDSIRKQYTCEGICFMCYFECEAYYCRLNYNMAQIIVNNIHLLKRRLSLQNDELQLDEYQHMEAHIYYYLFHENDNWNFYIPENTPKLREIGCTLSTDKKLTDLLICYYNRYGAIIYRQWLVYKHSLEGFKTWLENIDIDKSVQCQTKNLPKYQSNSLLLIPYMRDHHSLQKISEYLRNKSYLDFEKDKHKSILIIQRIIQITGELMKGTDSSLHLSPTTLALLKAEIPDQIFDHIHTLREDFIHVRNAKMIRKIDLESNRSDIFKEVIKDLNEIEHAITEVIKVYKPVLEKSIFQLDLLLISDEINSNDIDKDIINKIKKAHNYCSRATTELNLYKTMVNDIAQTHGISFQKVLQIKEMANNKTDLEKQLSKRTKQISVLMRVKQSKYIESIQKSIDNMQNQNIIWQSILQDLTSIQFPSAVIILDYPNQKSIDIIKSELNEIKKQIISNQIIKNEAKKNKKQKISPRKKYLNSISESLHSVTDSTVQWEQVKGIVKFMGLQDRINKIKHRTLVELIECITTVDNPNITGINNVHKFITEYKKYFCHRGASTTAETNNTVIHVYKGLQNLTELMKVKFFATQHEMDYLKSNTNNICDCKSAKSCIHSKILEKLYANNVINEKQQKIINSLNINKKTKKIIANLSNGSRRSNNMLECLVNRTEVLSSILEGESDLDKLVFRYRHDEKFKMLIEIITSDILNIYTEGGLKKLVNANYTKLLSEYPLRDLLAHGNPLLELCSSIIDANDVPSAYMNFALDAVKDKLHLKSLFELYEDGVSHDDVKFETSLNDSQKQLVNHFKENGNWELYIRLIYEY